MKLFSPKLFSPKFAMRCVFPIALTAGLALAPLASHAQVAGLTFSFAPPAQTVGIGGSADYTGIFSNTTTTNYFVTSGVYNFDTIGGSPLVSGFFNGDVNNGFSPFEILAGKTYTFSGVETLSADPSLGSGTYTGLVDFQGQTEADFRAGTAPDISLSSAPVTLIVDGGTPPVPEASTLVSLGLMLLLGGAGIWRGRRRGAAGV